MEMVSKAVFDDLRKDRDRLRKLCTRTQGELERLTVELAEERRARHAEQRRAASHASVFGGG